VQEGREVMAEMETENEQLQEAVEGLQEQVDAYEAEISQVRYASLQPHAEHQPSS
jgi:uncharacterized protein YlxW (UPF0749 family)